MWCGENESVACFEGWPNWLADVVTRDFSNRYAFSGNLFSRRYTALYTRSQESPNTCDGFYNNPETTEGFVGALLRDIEDATQDDHDDDADPQVAAQDGVFDLLCLGVLEIFQVREAARPLTITDFISQFQSRYSQHIGNLRATAFNVGTLRSRTLRSALFGLQVSSLESGLRRIPQVFDSDLQNSLVRIKNPSGTRVRDIVLAGIVRTAERISLALKSKVHKECIVEVDDTIGLSRVDVGSRNLGCSIGLLKGSDGGKDVIDVDHALSDRPIHAIEDADNIPPELVNRLRRGLQGNGRQECSPDNHGVQFERGGRCDAASGDEYGVFVPCPHHRIGL